MNEPLASRVQISHLTHREGRTFAKSFANTSGRLLDCFAVILLIGILMAIAGALGR
jgi:hypothetical protein